MFSQKVLAFIENSKPVKINDWLEIRSLVEEIGGRLFFFGERLPIGVSRLCKGEVVFVFKDPRTFVYVSESTPMEWKYSVEKDGVRYYPVVKLLGVDGDNENFEYLNKRLRASYQRWVSLPNTIELPIPLWVDASCSWENSVVVTTTVFSSEVEQYVQPFIDELQKLIKEAKNK